MTTTNSFLGILVEGDIVRRDPKIKQRPLEEFAPILQAVLDDESIVEFGWHQYTPHFNDGDPCEFGVGSPWFRTVQNVAASKPADGEDDGEDDGETWQLELCSNTTLGERRRTWNREKKDWEYGDYVGTDAARYDRCQALKDAMGSGAFDEVLLAAFGDHAEVTVKRDGIQVDFYSHD